MTDATHTEQPQRNTGRIRLPKPPSWIRRLFIDANPLRVVGGVLLIVLVFAAAGCAVTFFAAAQFQSRVAELSLNGAPMTIWRVDDFRNEFKDWSKEVRKLRTGIAQDQTNLAAKEKQNNLVSTAEAQSATQRLGDDARSLQQRVLAALRQAAALSTSVSPIPTALSAISDPAASGSIARAPDPLSVISDVLTQIDLLLTNDDLQKRFGDNLAALKKSYAGNADLHAANQAREAEIAAKEIWIASLQEKRKDLVDGAAKLFGETNATVAPELVERIVNVTAELDSLSNIWHGMIYRTALWTNDMLVLLLLISMGVLGSALNLLAVFIANDRESLSFGEYPLRLAFGAVLAIVMFIIAKAGVPILADTSKIGGNAPLNPYFISLLAVVSGLMSDRSMSTIRNVANTMLQSVGGAGYTPRYTRVVLDDVTKQANRDTDGLARLLEIGTDDVTKLFSGNEAVTPDQQKLIAAYLGRPLRELFSDLPAT